MGEHKRKQGIKGAGYKQAQQAARNSKSRGRWFVKAPEKTEVKK